MIAQQFTDYATATSHMKQQNIKLTVFNKSMLPEHDRENFAKHSDS